MHVVQVLRYHMNPQIRIVGAAPVLAVDRELLDSAVLAIMHETPQGHIEALTHVW